MGCRLGLDSSGIAGAMNLLHWCKSHRVTILRFVANLTILFAAVIYPGAFWKRIVGALIAFAFVEWMIPFPASRGDGPQEP